MGGLRFPKQGPSFCPVLCGVHQQLSWRRGQDSCKRPRVGYGRARAWLVPRSIRRRTGSLDRGQSGGGIRGGASAAVAGSFSVLPALGLHPRTSVTTWSPHRGALYRYWRQGQTGGRLTALLLGGTIPGVVAGAGHPSGASPGPRGLRGHSRCRHLVRRWLATNARPDDNPALPGKRRFARSELVTVPTRSLGSAPGASPARRASSGLCGTDQQWSQVAALPRRHSPTSRRRLVAVTLLALVDHAKRRSRFF